MERMVEFNRFLSLFSLNIILPIITDRQYLRRVDIAGHEVHTPVSGSNRSTELKHEAPSYPPQQ